MTEISQPMPEMELTDADRQKIQETTEKIDLTDSSLCLIYGTAGQKKLADVSDKLLKMTRNDDSAAVGERISDLVKELQACSDTKVQSGFFGWLFRRRERKNLRKQCETAIQNADRIAAELESRKLSLARFGRGSMQFIEGLSMKVLLANQIGAIADEVRALAAADTPQILSDGLSSAQTLAHTLTAGSDLSTVTAWIGSLAYFFQIYFDFAGYSLMAIGLGHMLGFTFIKNFDHPYLSVSVTEFWRRWHISLGTWFREYVYIPLGGNRAGIVRHICNILIVWMLTGLWHGAAWNFVLWGLYYGVLLLLEKYVISRLPVPKVLGWIYTMTLVIIGWVFFSGETLEQSVTILKAMFGMGSHAASGNVFFDQTSRYYLYTGWRTLLLCTVFATPLPGLLRDRLFKTGAGRMALTIIYVALLALAIMYLVVQNYNPFLYFRF